MSDELWEGRFYLKKNILVTGPPRSGKSTLIERIVSELKSKGLTVGGINTPEIREENRRIGFWITDLMTGEKGIMAHVEINKKYRVGKYGVDLETIKRIGVAAIRHAIENAEIIVLDEIGKMELFSREFKNAIEDLLNSEKTVIGTIGLRLHDNFAYKVKSRNDVELFFLTNARLNEVYQKIKIRLNL